MVVAVELVSDVTDSDRYRKTLRIKSYKAFEWLQSERTTDDLLTAMATRRSMVVTGDSSTCPDGVSDQITGSSGNQWAIKYDEDR